MKHALLPLLTTLLPFAASQAGVLAGDKNPVPVSAPETRVEWTASVVGDYVAASDFRGGKYGDQAVAHSEFRLGVALPVQGDVYFTLNGFHRRFDFGVSDAPVPTTLQSTGAELGLEYRVKGETAVGIRFSPGFYGSELDSHGFNVPVLIGGSWYLTPRFVFGLGISYNQFRENQVLPVIGFRWKPNDAWTVKALLPELDVSYAVSPDWVFEVGAKYLVGTFQTSSDEQHHSGTYLEYSDLRAGAGVKYSGLKPFDVSLNAGWSFQRKFRYAQADEEYKTEGAPYVAVKVSATF